MISRVEYNKFTDEFYITIPDDIVELLALEPDDILVWSIDDTNNVYLAKQIKD